MDSNQGKHNYTIKRFTLMVLGLVLLTGCIERQSNVTYSNQATIQILELQERQYLNSLNMSERQRMGMCISDIIRLDVERINFTSCPIIDTNKSVLMTVRAYGSCKCESTLVMFEEKDYVCFGGSIRSFDVRYRERPWEHGSTEREHLVVVDGVHREMICPELSWGELFDESCMELCIGEGVAE